MNTENHVEVEGVLSNLGGSLPVPNVQALAASQDLTKVPERYIRPEINGQTVFDNGEIVHGEIPVIDFAKIADQHSSEDEAKKLQIACGDWGFFQLVNHGVPEEVIENVKRDIEGFFKLPLEQKLKSAQPRGSTEGYGQAFVMSEEQKLDWADMFYLATQPKAFRNEKLWPNQPATFRASIENYSMEMKRVSDPLLRAMSKNLGLAEDKLSELFEDGMQSMRMNYYPPCPEPDRVLGLSPHADSIGLTILLQISPVQGLQIKRNGGWLPVIPLPNAFIVNIGDILEVMSNGKFKSIEHRAVINISNEVRMSIATFHNPNFDVPVGPLAEVVRGGKEHYKTIDQKEFLRLLFANKLDGKNHLDTMKLD